MKTMLTTTTECGCEIKPSDEGLIMCCSHGRSYEVWDDLRLGLDKTETPPIVCLCGSTRFSEVFQAANLSETLAGKIVLTVGCDTKGDDDLFAVLPPDELKKLKTELDVLHFRKIDLADEVFILNVDGYIGESTARELEYARNLGKRVRFLEGDDD